jgi:hypothetical protein
MVLHVTIEMLQKRSRGMSALLVKRDIICTSLIDITTLENSEKSSRQDAKIKEQ